MCRLLTSLTGRVTLLIVSLCLAVIFHCQAQIGFQVSPAKLYFNPTGTTEQTLRVHVANLMDVPLALQASCADWHRDSTGNKQFFRAGTLPQSCCSLIRVTPSTIELGPRQEQDVLVTVTLDKSKGKLAELRNGMLMLTQTNAREVAAQKGASQIIIKGEIGVHLYVLPEESAKPDIAITGMEVVKSEGQYQVKVAVHNTGGTSLESQLRLEYLNTQTMNEVKPSAVPVNTMPKEAFKVTTPVPPNVSSGKYLIVAILDSGPNQTLKVAELEAVLK